MSETLKPCTQDFDYSTGNGYYIAHLHADINSVLITSLICFPALLD